MQRLTWFATTVCTFGLSTKNGTFSSVPERGWLVEAVAPRLGGGFLILVELAEIGFSMSFSTSIQGGYGMEAMFRRRLMNAAVVVMREREVSRHARETEQSRETIYRDFRRVSHELEEGTKVRDEQQRRIRELEAENARLAKQIEPNPFENPDKVAQFAATAQAEGVSLPVARRLLTILQARGRRR